MPGQYVEFDSSQAGTSTQARRMRVVGQTADGSSATADEVKRVDSVGKMDALFKAGSQVGALGRGLYLLARRIKSVGGQEISVAFDLLGSAPPTLRAYNARRMN